MTAGLRPVAPGCPPMQARRQHLRHRIKPARATRPAPRHPKQCQPETGPEAMPCKGFITVLGTGRDMSTGIADKAGERQLVETDEAHPEKPPGRLAERPPPVARAIGGRRPIVIAIRRTAHDLSRRRPCSRHRTRSGREHRRRHQRSAWSRRDVPDSPSPASGNACPRSGRQDRRRHPSA